jgi:superfamily II DNA or RNA helicase
MSEIQKYIDLKTNGRLFPLWVMANFKKYKLPPLQRVEGEDLCNKPLKDNINELRNYQSFLGGILDYKSPYRDALVYHGLGSGKTVTAINVYNIVYNYNPSWNIFILIKASLRDDPWLKDLKNWIPKDNFEERMSNIKFIHYDAPNADKLFLNAIKESDATKKNMYIFDEAHNFIKNVYNNIITKTGKRALTIYDYIINEKKDSKTRVILLSGTPAVNTPYELALIFNLLRPDSFPKTETKFNDIYILRTVNEHVLNPENKNMFQRRILGLVSYYIGADPALFAKKEVKKKFLCMDKYQKKVYEFFEDIELQLEKQRAANRSSQTVYRTYTRQSSNFVFPVMGGDLNGENRPRPSKFKLSDKDAEKIISGRYDDILKDSKMEKKDFKNVKNNASVYIEAVNIYIKSFINYLDSIVEEDKKNNTTLENDIEIFKNKYKFKFNKFMKDHKQKSKLLTTLNACSCKMIGIIFYMMRSKGPVLVFSNFVKMEGLEIFKIYLSYFGFSEFGKTAGEDYFRYTEFHGEIDKDIRVKNKTNFNLKDNIDGKIIKIILISPAGSEGINLLNVRQVHILEPYWNEVRNKQLIGRAVRMCSHKDLPMEERKVDIYRYHVTRKSKKTPDAKITTDEDILELAEEKETLIDSFLQTIREAAVDCELFKTQNMIDGEYSCFKFNEKSYFDKFIGPAYKQDIYYDKKIDNGLNSVNSVKKKIKVVKIKAVYLIDEEYSEVGEYWYYPDSGVVYDLDLDFPLGRILKDFGIPKKLDKETYIIDEIINIPKLKN